MSFWETLTWETQTSRQREEFRKKYMGSYVFLTLPDRSKEVFVKTHDLESDGNEHYWVFSIPNSEQRIRLVHDTNAIIRAAFPKPTLVNYGNTFYYVCRIPARQYKKGITSENTWTISPMHRLFRCSAMPMRNFDPMIALEAFNPTFYDWDVALELLDRGDKIGVAINSHLAIGLSNQKGDAYVVWYNTYIVGTYRDGKITLLNEFIKQEILDQLRIERINVEVV